MHESTMESNKRELIAGRSKEASCRSHSVIDQKLRSSAFPTKAAARLPCSSSGHTAQWTSAEPRVRAPVRALGSAKTPAHDASQKRETRGSSTQGAGGRANGRRLGGVAPTGDDSAKFGCFAGPPLLAAHDAWAPADALGWLSVEEGGPSSVGARGWSPEELGCTAAPCTNAPLQGWVRSGGRSL